MSMNPGDTPTLVAYQANWSATFTAVLIDVTTLQSVSAQYIRGAGSVSGDFSGFYDDADSLQPYLTATAGGAPRTLTIYPDAANAGRYFTGTVVADFAASAGVASAGSVSVTWDAAPGTQFTLTTGGIYGPVYFAVY